MAIVVIKLKTKLYKHQIDNLNYSLKHLNSADWSDPGTGKSITALAKIVNLYNVGIVRKILIVCPLSVLITWAIEIKKHTTFTFTEIHGSLNQKIASLSKDSDIYITTYDSIPGRESTRGKFLYSLLNKMFDIIVCDEIPMIKSYGAKRTKAVTFLCDCIPLKIFLSGTPITNSPTDVFTIYRALDGGETFGKNFFASRNKYFKNVGFKFPKWTIREEMKDNLTQKMYDIAVRSKKGECLDLPPKIWTPRFTRLSKEQLSFYIPIAENLLTDFKVGEERVSIRNVLTKISKLSQITSGFLYTDKEPMLFRNNPKLDLLGMVVQEFLPSEKIIVYCRWREDVKLLIDWFDYHDFDYAVLDGETKDRKGAIESFQTGHCKILISNISVGKYSLTLTASSTIIYYSLGFSLEDFIQSSDRIHRISQTKTCIYIPLMVENSIDSYIYNTLERKMEIASSLTDLNCITQNLEETIGGKL